jgi:RNA-directed DNA polymerase
VIPPHLFYQTGLDRGVPAPALQRASAERARLLARGAYPIFSLGHLAHETGATYTYLREVVSRTRDPYRSIAIPKASGGVRSISAPEPIIADVQRWILANLLLSLPANSASFAYQPGRSIVQCAEQHIGAQWMIKLDLHNFFDTVTEPQVYRVFRNLGYKKLVAFELARITTRAEGAKHRSWLAATRTIPSYAVDTRGVLPQGAPTSGQLANAVAGELDDLLQTYSLQEGLTYSRYSDDLMFSSRDHFRRPNAEKAVRHVSGLIVRAGFIVHRSKTRIVPPGARRVVLGLLVDDSVRLLPEHRRRIEVHLHGCEKFGLANHASHRGFESVFSFVNHLGGWIAFALGVEPTRALAWRERLYRLLTKEGLQPN